MCNEIILTYLPTLYFADVARAWLPVGAITEEGTESPNYTVVSLLPNCNCVATVF